MRDGKEEGDEERETRGRTACFSVLPVPPPPLSVSLGGEAAQAGTMLPNL